MINNKHNLSFKKVRVRPVRFVAPSLKYVKKVLKLALLSVLKSKWIYSLALNQAMKNLELGKKGFALPSIFSTIHFSSKLKVTIPLAALERELHDWIEVDSKVMHIHQCFIVRGDLLPITKKLRYFALSKEIQHLKAANWDYKRTGIYEKIKNEISLNTPRVSQQLKLDSEEKIHNYFSRVESLYHSIAEKGLLHVDEFGVEGRKSYPIYVGIDAVGRFLKLPSGKHRLAIANVLNIKNVPVVVNMIHYDWIKHKAMEKGVSEYQAICIILNDFKQLQ